MLVLLKKKLVSNPERRLNVLELTFSCVTTVRLVAIYATNTWQSDYFRELKKCLVTLHSLLLVRDFNFIHDDRVASVRSNTDRGVSDGFWDLVSCFH